jgi:hypothetical protein
VWLDGFITTASGDVNRFRVRTTNRSEGAFCKFGDLKRRDANAVNFEISVASGEPDLARSDWAPWVFDYGTFDFVEVCDTRGQSFFHSTNMR